MSEGGRMESSKQFTLLHAPKVATPAARDDQGGHLDNAYSSTILRRTNDGTAGRCSRYANGVTRVHTALAKACCRRHRRPSSVSLAAASSRCLCCLCWHCRLVTRGHRHHGTTTSTAEWTGR